MSQVCPKCGGKMVELFTSCVCDACDPPARVGPAVTVKGGVISFREDLQKKCAESLEAIRNDPHPFVPSKTIDYDNASPLSRRVMEEANRATIDSTKKLWNELFPPTKSRPAWMGELSPYRHFAWMGELSPYRHFDFMWERDPFWEKRFSADERGITLNCDPMKKDEPVQFCVVKARTRPPVSFLAWHDGDPGASCPVCASGDKAFVVMAEETGASEHFESCHFHVAQEVPK